MKYNNRILAVLSPDDLQFLSANLNQVRLRPRDILIDAGERLETVHFIERGLASVLTVMSDGSSIEIGMMGNEGVVGVMAVLGVDISAQQIVVQGDGTALAISTTACRKLYNKSPNFRLILNRFAEAMFTLSGQTAACNRLHPIEGRLARWLLMASDRTNNNTMGMTHEFLANMLGVRRVGVTQAAGDLQRSGLIEYRRGQLNILNRNGLQALACECYHLDHDRLGNLVQNGEYRSIDEIGRNGT